MIKYITSEVVIESLPHRLARRVLKFELIDADVVLNSDVDEERATKKHKFRPVRQWVRNDSRRSTIERRDVPQHAIDAAMADIRSQIIYRDEAG